MPDAKGTTVAGENNGGSKLTEKQVLEIRQMYGAYRDFPMRLRKELEVTIPALAYRFEVHKGTIARIISRSNWICVAERKIE